MTEFTFDSWFYDMPVPAYSERSAFTVPATIISNFPHLDYPLAILVPCEVISQFMQNTTNKFNRSSIICFQLEVLMPISRVSLK